MLYPSTLHYHSNPLLAIKQIKKLIPLYMIKCSKIKQFCQKGQKFVGSVLGRI